MKRFLFRLLLAMLAAFALGYAAAGPLRQLQDLLDDAPAIAGDESDEDEIDYDGWIFQ